MIEHLINSNTSSLRIRELKKFQYPNLNEEEKKYTDQFENLKVAFGLMTSVWILAKWSN